MEFGPDQDLYGGGRRGADTIYDTKDDGAEISQDSGLKSVIEEEFRKRKESAGSSKMAPAPRQSKVAIWESHVLEPESKRIKDLLLDSRETGFKKLLEAAQENSIACGFQMNSTTLTPMVQRLELEIFKSINSAHGYPSKIAGKV